MKETKEFEINYYGAEYLFILLLTIVSRKMCSVHLIKPCYNQVFFSLFKQVHERYHYSQRQGLN